MWIVSVFAENLKVRISNWLVISFLVMDSFIGMSKDAYSACYSQQIGASCMMLLDNLAVLLCVALSYCTLLEVRRCNAPLLLYLSVLGLREPFGLVWQFCLSVSPKGFLAACFGSILLVRVEHRYLRPFLSVVNRAWCLHIWPSDCYEAPSYRWDADAVTAFDAPLWNSQLGCKWLAFWGWRDTKES